MDLLINNKTFFQTLENYENDFLVNPKYDNRGRSKVFPLELLCNCNYVYKLIVVLST